MEQISGPVTLAAAARVAQKIATCGLGRLAWIEANQEIGVRAKPMYGPARDIAETVRDYAVAWDLELGAIDVPALDVAREVHAHGAVDGVPVTITGYLDEAVPLYSLGLAPLPDGGLLDAATAEAIEEENRRHEYTSDDCADLDQDATGDADGEGQADVDELAGAR